MSSNFQGIPQNASNGEEFSPPTHAKPSDSGVYKFQQKSGNLEKDSINNPVFAINEGTSVIEEKKKEENICDENGQGSYIKRLEEQQKLRLEALNYEKISDKEKTNYMGLYQIYFGQLHLIVQAKVDKKKELIALKESLAPNLGDFLEKWGPKRCLMYLKLASVYNKIGNDQKKDELLDKAEEDLNQMRDEGDICECRRWLYLQRIESYLNRVIDKRELSKEGKLLEKCWNVTQRYFEGRRDFLDFYTIFLAKHLLRTGDYKKAEEAYYNACLLRRLRKDFWDKDDFDWNKLEKEVKKEIDEKNTSQ